jgi:hypothetical protein
MMASPHVVTERDHARQVTSTRVRVGCVFNVFA